MSQNQSARNRSDFRGLASIVRREIGQFFSSRSGYLLTALFLGIYGLVFNVFAIGAEPRFSSEVLAGFFYAASGVTMFVAPLISMRLIAEERQTGKVPVLRMTLRTSPYA